MRESTDELVYIEDGQLNQGQFKAPPGRALEIARQFSEGRDAIDLLPSIAQHHAFNMKIIAGGRDGAQRIAASLDARIAASSL